MNVFNILTNGHGPEQGVRVRVVPPRLSSNGDGAARARPARERARIGLINTIVFAVSLSR